MRLFSVIVMVKPPAGMTEETVQSRVGLEHKGNGFLVLKWRENLTKMCAQPERVIPLHSVGVHFSTGIDRAHTTEPVPSFVLEDRVPPELSRRYPVQDGPLALFRGELDTQAKVHTIRLLLPQEAFQHAATPAWPD